MGKFGLLVGTAAIALLTASGAQAAVTTNDVATASNDSGAPKVVNNQIQLAQNTMPSQGNSASTADLEARVRALEESLAARDERSQTDRTRLSTLEQQYNYASWTFDNGRPVIATGDGRFTMGVRVRFQSDFAAFSQDSTHPTGFAGPSDLSSGAVVRRAYFGIEGKAYNDFSYEFRLNAGGTNGGSNGASGGVTAGEGDPLLNKAVVTYTGVPNWHFSAGVIEPAFMFEGTTSSAQLMFLERPEIDNIAADTFGAGDSRRGIEIGWAKTDALWAGDNLTATATFSGQKTGSAANHGSGNAPASGNGDENTQVLGRVTERLWTNGLSNIQIGVSGAKVLSSGSNGNANGGSQAINLQDRPEVRVDGTRLISTGGVAAKTADMFAVDLGGNIENFFLGGEYAQFTLDRQCGGITSVGNAACVSSTAVIDHPTFSGWYVEGSWILTGETKAYSPAAINNEVGGFNGPVPSRPFSMSGGSWGAFELVARYSNTDLNWHTNQLATTSQLAGVLGGEERVIALGLNWYLNRNVRVMIDDNIISVKKGTAAIPNRDGQDINVLGVRLQFAN
jgi:phosphate-selective porin OprO/OprP